MPTQLDQNTAYVKNESDVVPGSSNNGASSGTATRFANVNPDIGNASTNVSTDGDLRLIDTDAESLAADPAANSSGTASAGYSLLFLARWIVRVLQTIGKRTPALGQAAMSASSPVVVASDQTAIPASQSGTWNIANISGTVSLPTGAATAANQTTANTSLASIDGKLPSTLGAKTGTASLSIVPATDALLKTSDSTGAIFHGRTTNASTSTAVVLASSQAINSGARIRALPSNTGIIYVGLTGVTSTSGYPLYAGEELFLPVSNLNIPFILPSVENEGVVYIAA